MHYKQILSNSFCPFIHANGPSKYEESWDKAVKRYFQEEPVKGTMSKDLTVITWSIPTEETLLENCFTHYNIRDRLIVIPMGKPFDFLDKIRKTYKYLSRIKTKYVMGLDATDVMPFGYDACDVALNIFKNKNVKGVFGAEKEQWPNPVTMKGIVRPVMDAPKDMGTWIDELKDARRIEEVYEWLGSPFKHLCSGTWIGEREYMLGFYKECMDLIPEGFHEESLFGGDQGFITLVAARRYPKIILDSKSEMFLQLAFTTKKEVELVID